MKGIISVTQVSIQCSNCSESYVDAHLTQRQAIIDARKDGWSIGKKILCPKCRNRERVK